jgi:hypothetical protein
MNSNFSCLKSSLYIIGAAHTENTALLSSRFHFRGNVYAELLPINVLFQLTGDMSQYEEENVYDYLSMLATYVCYVVLTP